MTLTVFDKTDQGRAEIATRQHHLAPRLRTLLLLVDGKRDTVELMSKVSGLGLDEKALVELLEGGFIEVAGALDDGADEQEPAPAAAVPVVDTIPVELKSVAPAAASPAAAEIPVQERRASPAPAPEAAQPAVATTAQPSPAPQAIPAAPADNPAMPTGAAVPGMLREGETQFQALYNFFNETIRSAIGLRGYGMQLKVERAVTVEDFRGLRQQYLDAVLKAKGPELEHSLRNRLDQLLSLGD